MLISKHRSVKYNSRVQSKAFNESRPIIIDVRQVWNGWNSVLQFLVNFATLKGPLLSCVEISSDPGLE
jgi:hypothetical protein